MKRILLFFAFGIFATGNMLNAQLTPKYGNDLLIDTVAGKVYSNVRITTAYDGTIYYARLVADSKTDWPRQWEIYQSTDGGVSFNLFKSDAFQASSTRRIACMDICAAGENATDFRLYFSAPSTDTVAHKGYMNAVCFDSLGNRTILPINGEINDYTVNTDKRYQLGFNSVSWATDSRRPSVYSTPYTVTLLTTKQSGANNGDSLILYSSNGGTTFQRKGLYRSTININEIATSIGVGRKFDGSNYVKDQPILGYIFNSSYRIRVGFIYPLDMTNVYNVVSITNTLQPLVSGRIYSPSIALSQTNSDTKTGLGYDDIRCFVAYNIGDTLCMSYRDSLLTGSGLWSSSLKNNTQMYKNGPVNGTLYYDPIYNNFLLTYYNRLNRKLPYEYRKLPNAGFGFVTSTSSYRDVITLANPFIKPQLAVRPANGTLPVKAVFAWQDGNATLFDAEDAVFVKTVDVNKMSAIKIYPNPTNGIVNVSSEASLVQVRFFNLAGQEVTSSTTIIGNQINLSSLNQGIYFLQVIDERGNMNTIKVIKE